MKSVLALPLLQFSTRTFASWLAKNDRKSVFSGILGLGYGHKKQ